MAQEPMIKLDPNGTAPVLSYNVPEPASYTGRHVIELELPADCFRAAASTVPTPSLPPASPPPGSVGGGVILPIVVAPATHLSVLARVIGDAPAAAASGGGSVPTASVPTALAAPAPGLGQPTRSIVMERRPPVLKLADDEDAKLKELQGYRYARYLDLAGEPAVRVLPPVPPEPRPRLLLVEVYRMSSYLGAYGAGRVLKTMTLLPGEKTKISLKTYTRSSSESKQASSVLDSFTQESANDFESSLSQEQSDKQSESENFEYHAEAEASASWGWGSAKVSGGVKGGTTSAREEFAKNVSSATQKHTSKASAKRDVQVNTSYEVKEETGEETSIERTIENVNLSRTLNFVFRQMNQQFITILHLVDVRVAFFNGSPASAREVAMPNLERLLGEYILPERRAEVKEAILNQVRTVRDHDGTERPFVEEVDLGGGDTYLRVKKDLLYSYTEPVTEQTVTFTGIPTAVDKYTMRTEGVIVETLLGQAEALDKYARQLQAVEVRRRTAEAEKLEADAKRAALVVTLAGSGDPNAAPLVSALLGTPAAAPALSPSPPPGPVPIPV